MVLLKDRVSEHFLADFVFFKHVVIEPLLNCEPLIAVGAFEQFVSFFVLFLVVKSGIAKASKVFNAN